MMQQMGNLSDRMWRPWWTACRDHSEGVQDWPLKVTDHGTLCGEWTGCVYIVGASSVPQPRSSAYDPNKLGGALTVYVFVDHG